MENFDEVLASGDEEAIETALADVDVDEAVLFNEDSTDDDDLPDDEPSTAAETPDETPPEPESQDTSPDAAPPSDGSAEHDVNPEESPESSQGAQPTGEYLEQDGKFYVPVKDIQSRNGEHSLPFEVLKAAREDAKAATQAKSALTQENEKLQSKLRNLERLTTLHSEQLKAANIEPKLLPDEMLANPALMDRLKEDYPELGDVISAMAEKLQQLTASPVPQDTAPELTALETAFRDTAHLQQWQTNDPDRWAMARLIDSRLAEDPSFVNTPIPARLAEVEKRVMTAFGDSVAADDAAPAPSTEARHTPQPTAPVPNTPSDLGHAGSDERANNGLLDMDADSMMQQMQGMSEAQIEAVLNEVSDVL